MTSKLHINKVRILELPSKQFQGEAYCEGELVAQTIKHQNKTNCIKVLNKKIEEYNTLKDKNVPLMKPDGKEILYGQSKSAVVEDAETVVEAASNQVAKPEITQTKPTKPKRKPFTPYGLNGYLVDKQGNVRLMLDRRASAQTIVLDPAMFAALAEMVQRTQEQKNG